MSSINFMGSYSGIDRSTIDQLMEAEKMPLVGLASKKTDTTEKQNAWKDINTRLNSLFDKLKALQTDSTYTSKTSSSTNEDTVTMSVGSSAAPATYKINVESLATTSRVIGAQVTVEDNTTALSQTGDLTITNGDPEALSTTISIGATDSLSSVMDKINEGTEETGIKATIIDKRLVLEDTKTGNRNISVGGSAADGLGLVAKAENDFEMKLGTDAKFSINGIEVTRSSNTISDVIEGVSISLKNTHESGLTDTVTVGMDTKKTEDALKAFVDQYNSTMTFLEDKMAAGTPDAPATRGVLAGDGTLQRLHSSLRQMVTSSISNKDNTDISDISQLGVTTVDRFGKLIFDSTKLKEHLESNMDNVKNFFSSETSTGDEIGFSHRLGDYVDSFISKTNGVIKGKTDSFERSLKDIDRQIENFNRRIEKKEEYYIKMFSALDVAMMQAESQMEWLNGQISAMNAQSAANKK